MARTHCWKCGTPMHRVTMVDDEGWTNGVSQCETRGCVSISYRRKLIVGVEGR